LVKMLTLHRSEHKLNIFNSLFLSRIFLVEKVLKPMQSNLLFIKTSIGVRILKYQEEATILFYKHHRCLWKYFLGEEGVETK